MFLYELYSINPDHRDACVYHQFPTQYFHFNDIESLSIYDNSFLYIIIYIIFTKYIFQCMCPGV